MHCSGVWLQWKVSKSSYTNLDKYQAKKLIRKKRKIRPATPNIGTLTDKSKELVNKMKRRVDVTRLQEAKCKGDKAKEINDSYNSST